MNSETKKYIASEYILALITQFHGDVMNQIHGVHCVIVTEIATGKILYPTNTTACSVETRARSKTVTLVFTYKYVNSLKLFNIVLLSIKLLKPYVIPYG